MRSILQYKSTFSTMQRWSFGEIELRFRRKGNGVSPKSHRNIAEKPSLSYMKERSIDDVLAQTSDNQLGIKIVWESRISGQRQRWLRMQDSQRGCCKQFSLSFWFFHYFSMCLVMSFKFYHYICKIKIQPLKIYVKLTILWQENIYKELRYCLSWPTC